MGHEVVVYGFIECPGSRATADYRQLQTLNRSIIRRLPEQDDDYPRLTRALFTLPSDALTYRRQLIHFGCTFKDDPYDDRDVPAFINKFEALLKTLYWDCARLHVQREIADELLLEYRATDVAVAALYQTHPQAVTEWSRVEFRGAADGGLAIVPRAEAEPGKAPWWKLGR